MWPKLDSKTIVVSPLSIKSLDQLCICPELPADGYLAPLSKDLSIGISKENGTALTRMLWSSDNMTFEEIYRNAYDDATRVLREKGLKR